MDTDTYSNKLTLEVALYLLGCFDYNSQNFRMLKRLVCEVGQEKVLPFPVSVTALICSAFDRIMFFGFPVFGHPWALRCLYAHKLPLQCYDARKFDNDSRFYHRYYIPNIVSMVLSTRPSRFPIARAGPEVKLRSRTSSRARDPPPFIGTAS